MNVHSLMFYSFSPGSRSQLKSYLPGSIMQGCTGASYYFSLYYSRLSG